MPKYRFVNLLGLGIVCAALVACSPTADSPPHEPAPATSTQPPLPAGVGFPDMANYSEADRSVYYSDDQRYHGFSFRTPAGQQCTTNSYPSPEYTTIQCWGPRPDKGPGDWSVIAKRTVAAKIRPLPADGSEVDRSQIPVLAPSHVVVSSEGERLCGVDADGGVACRVGDHGFVLTPDKTTLF